MVAPTTAKASRVDPFSVSAEEFHNAFFTFSTHCLIVAVKIIDRAVVKEDYVLRNLEREARILSFVSHPCILYIYETIQYHSLYCIVTEMLPGKNLCDFTKGQPGGRLNERTARRFVRQLASALDHMHSRGIVHRDLKMQNIVVDVEQSLVKIIDFGLSNYWSLEEPLSTHCGSPEYAAPELFIVGRKYGPEVDLWSLGVVVFCMSAGCLPFSLNERERSLSHDQQRRLLVTRIRKGIVQKHKNYVSHYSKEFINLISGLLATKPNQRFHVEQVLCHPWTTKSPSLLLDIPKNVIMNSGISGKIIMKICTIVNSAHKDVEKRIRKEPLGPLGGIHRILYHKELKKHWRMLEVFSPLHTLSGSLSSGSLVTRHRNQMNMRTCASKAKPLKNFITGVNSANASLEKFSWDCCSSENQCIHQPDSDMDFKEEPWASNFSSAIMNNQMSLIVTKLRSHNCPYNHRKPKLPNFEGESLEFSCTIEEESGTTQSDTSTAESSRMSAVANTKNGIYTRVNTVTEKSWNNMKREKQYEA